MQEIEWARLKAAELAQVAKHDAIVMVPIGSTEQHGPHLPTQVDLRLVTEVAHRAARLMTAHAPNDRYPDDPLRHERAPHVAQRHHYPRLRHHGCRARLCLQFHLARRI